jgi:excisionase family DNA binding protein
MTIAKAAKKYSLPKSRLVRAIASGLLPSTKAGGKRVLKESEIEEALGRKRDIVRDGQKFIIRERLNLCISDQFVEKFSTKAGADQFEKLFSRSNALKS